MDCGKITNAYDAMMGRLCPQCIAKRCAQFGKSLEMWGKGVISWVFDEERNMDYLAHGNKYLLTEPLIDHSNDIDRHLRR